MLERTEAASMQRFKAIAGVLLLILLLSVGTNWSLGQQPAEIQKMTKPRPKVIFFDVNETLLDLGSMQDSVSAALGDRKDLLPLWFLTTLHSSLVDTATGKYHDFATIGTAALMMVAESNGIPITESKAKAAIVGPLLSLPAHKDVKVGLEVLKSHGYTMVTFTNSSNLGVRKQMESAGLTNYFARNLSIEEIKTYKPFTKTYQWAAAQMGVKPEEALMVAAHGWDVAGAKAAGMQTAFVARPGQVMFPLADKPDYVVKDIRELADILDALPK
jgi:2-haloacid dehalogenase